MKTIDITFLDQYKGRFACHTESDDFCKWAKSREKLEEENIKLRNMVYVYRACHERINACCGCKELPDCDALKRLKKLGCELGIEVY